MLVYVSGENRVNLLGNLPAFPCHSIFGSDPDQKLIWIRAKTAIGHEGGYGRVTRMALVDSEST